MPRFICPLCHTPLHTDPRSWRCAQHHCFDVARDGHVNLLPVQHRKSRRPGDPPRMVLARREFLLAGHFAALRDAVAAELCSILPPKDQPLAPGGPSCVLDIGCGEGYYTSALMDASREVVGVDIAKPAIEAAARRQRGITWVVAGSARLPLEDRSVDAVTSLFAPLPLKEIVRVSRPGASLVVALAGAGHLAELRAALFDELREHDPGRTLLPLLASHEQQRSREIVVSLQLDQQDIGRLLDMTPYAWRAKPERVAALRERSGLQVTAVFSLSTFTLRSGVDS